MTHCVLQDDDQDMLVKALSGFALRVNFGLCLHGLHVAFVVLRTCRRSHQTTRGAAVCHVVQHDVSCVSPTTCVHLGNCIPCTACCAVISCRPSDSTCSDHACSQ